MVQSCAVYGSNHLRKKTFQRDQEVTQHFLNAIEKHQQNLTLVYQIDAGCKHAFSRNWQAARTDGRPQLLLRRRK